MVFHHVQEGYDQFLVLHRDDIVQILLDIREDNFSRRLYCGAVGDRINVRKCRDLPFSRDACIQFAPAGSTPITLIFGFRSFASVGDTRRKASPPIGTRM